MIRNEVQIPIQYSLQGDNFSATSPAIKEAEVDFLNAIIGVAEAFGATDVEISSVADFPDGTGKLVTLTANGSIDSEKLLSSLRQAIKGQDNQE